MTKARKIFVVLLAVCLMFCIAGCGEDNSQGAATDEQRTKLIVGFDAEYPPYGYMAEDGTYTGFDLELAAAVCEIYGWELVKTPINWDSKDMELNSGSIDCIWNGFTINGREDDYTWSKPYVDNSQVILVSTESGINTLADLADKKVGVQAASAALEMLQNEGEDGRKELADTFNELREFPNYNTAFVELQAGSIDAVAIDIGVAKYHVEEGNGEYKILDEILSTEQYGIGFRLGDTELRDQVEEGLDQLVTNGTYAQLAEKYELTDFICLPEEK